MVGLSLHAGFCFLISLLPQKSKLTLLSHKKAKKEEAVTKKANKFRRAALKATSSLPEAYAEEIARKAETQ